jgi:hypothetical protein
MADCYLDWQGDFVASASGDLLLATGVDEANQSLIRRFLTPTGGYFWHRGYGAGLPQKIGGLYTPETIKAVIQSQVALDSHVDQSQTVEIDVSAQPGGLYSILVKYTVAASGEPAVLSFTS